MQKIPMTLFLIYICTITSWSTLVMANPCEDELDPNAKTRKIAIQLLTTYGKAWETRDPDLITTIFTRDATYLDPKEPENFGVEAIRAYWISKVIGEQRDIKFDLRNVWVDGNTVIAEWYATFIDIKRNQRIEMKEVAIFSVRDNKFESLREYYKTTKTSL